MVMVEDLVRQLDGLNKLHPLSAEEDEEDMAWPGMRSECKPSTFSFRMKFELESYVVSEIKRRSLL